MNNQSKQKKHHRFILVIGLAILALITGACQRKSESSGGSVVGNGFIRHYDKSYDYFFDYASELNLTNTSESSLKLDNNSYATGLGLRTSVMTFEIIQLQDHNLTSVDDLKDIIAPPSRWQEIKKPRQDGFYYEHQDAGLFTAEYVYKIGQSHALHVTANAYPEAKGVKLLADVIKSLSFDTKSPIIHEVIYEPEIIKAGETAKLKIRATDNLNDISGVSPTGSVSIYSQQKCRQLLNKDWNLLEACGSFKKLENDWYELEVPTNPRMHPGEYVLGPLTLWDRAGNSVELIPDFSSRLYRPNTRDENAILPLVTLKIKNDDPDIFAPRFSNARFEPSTVTAGETTMLLFEAVDNDPNFYPHDFCERAHHKKWFKYIRSDVPKDAAIESTVYSIQACSKPTKRPDGLWSVTVRTEHGLPPGEYEMNLSISDSVGNRSHQEGVTLQLVNTGPIDLEGPKILDLKTDKKSYRRGDVGMITIHASDDISGVSEEATYLRLDLCRRGFMPSKTSDDDLNASNRILICDGALKRLGNNIYGMEFIIPDAAPTGNYTLPDISLSDRIGNRTYLTSKPSESNESNESNDSQNYIDKYNNVETSIETLTIKITP